MLASYTLAARADSPPLLNEIKVPTLIIAGAEDAFAQAETMHREIQHSQLVVVEQCGHLINLEQPRVFDQVVTGFLKQLQVTLPS